MKSLNYEFNSRRSMVMAQRGMVATRSPLASAAGLQILREGGNAADAAVAAAAVLSITHPGRTSIGGDCFALYFDAKTKTVSALNGSGRAPKALSIDYLEEQGITGKMPLRSPHSVTVPGAPMGFYDLLKRFGRMTFKEVFRDAIYYAREGHPVAPIGAASWNRGDGDVVRNGINAEDFLPNGIPPKIGQVIKLPGLAKTYQALAEEGPEVFYEGDIADAIIETLQEVGNVMTHDDLKNHTSTWGDPIQTDYRGYQVLEHPPNGQGLAALIALNIAEGWDLGAMQWDSPDKLHLMIEAMRLGFADARYYVADPHKSPAPLDALLSKSYAAERRAMVSADTAMTPPSYGTPKGTNDTVYLCTVDSDGNACSLIFSHYAGFGSGIGVKGYRFMLQNRGAGFELERGHPNALEGGKRPYHTIIPGMLMKDGEFVANFGVMAGFMQPQGHFQVVNGLIDDALNPQEALDRPRWRISDGTPSGIILLEEGIPVSTMARLAELGHVVKPMSGLSRGIFGVGQIIIRDAETGVLYGGSEPRADGHAAAY